MDKVKVSTETADAGSVDDVTPTPMVKLRALLTTPMPEPTRAGLVFMAPSVDARIYIANGWAEEVKEEGEEVMVTTGKAQFRVLPGTHKPGSADVAASAAAVAVEDTPAAEDAKKTKPTEPAASTK